MPVGNGVHKQQRAGIVPVVFRLDYFRASRGDKLAEIQLEALRLWRLETEESLLHVIELVSGTAVGWRGVDQVVGAAVDEVGMGTHRIGIVIERKLRSTQIELVSLVVEVVEVVDLA